jgi:hypothetical protein
VSIDGLCEGQTLVERDRDVGDVVLAAGAGVVAEEPRDVPRQRRIGRGMGHRSSPSGFGLALFLPGLFVVGHRAVRRRAAVDQLGTALVQHRDPLLDALKRLDDVTLEPDQHAHRVLVGALADLVRVRLGVGDDAPALLVSGLGQTALVDEERRLLLRSGNDAFGLFLGLLDNPLALGVDALGGADLFGNGDAQLVDETECSVLIDYDVGRQGQLLAVGDEGFEPLDEEDDVDRSVLLCRNGGGSTA